MEITNTSSHEAPRYCYYCHPSAEVEQTAYGILANLYANKPIVEIKPMLVWLTKQQNDQGGFRSTQVNLMHTITNIKLYIFIMIRIHIDS